MAAGFSGRITALTLVQGRFCSAQTSLDVHLEAMGTSHWEVMNQVPDPCVKQ